jgi:hypothetical protein
MKIRSISEILDLQTKINEYKNEAIIESLRKMEKRCP